MKIGLTITETLVIERSGRGELTLRIESEDRNYFYNTRNGIRIPTEYLGVVIETLKLHKTEADKAAVR